MRKTFLLVAGMFALFLAASTAPSPLYGLYQQQWHFSATLLTVVFAVYALTLLAALLILGALSDFIGRRPVLMVALVLAAGSMVIFALASSVAWLMAARVVQGVATGIATAAMSGSLIDNESKGTASAASLVNTVGAMGGMAIGALFAGLLVEYVVWPTQLVFWLLACAFVAMAVGVMLTPESVRKRPGWQASLKPIVALPSEARPALIAAGPSLVAGWALGGLYSSLGPSTVLDLLGSHNHFIGGLVIVALAGAGAITSLALRARTSQQLVVFGSIVAAVGLLVTAYAAARSSVMAFFVGSVIAGVGWGPAFTGAFRVIMNQAPNDQRAGLASTVYILSYLSFGIPVIAAGVAVTQVGLKGPVLVYSLGAAALYLLTLMLSRGRLGARE